MSKWTEYDPLYGVKETNVVDGESGQIIVNKTQDVEGLLERNAALRNTGATDIGIKEGFWHYATIPLAVQYELLKKGINVQSKYDRANLLDELNSNYKYLKTTNKVHSLRRNKVRPALAAQGVGNTNAANAEHVGKSLVLPSDFSKPVNG